MRIITSLATFVSRCLKSMYSSLVDKLRTGTPAVIDEQPVYATSTSSLLKVT